MGKGEQPANVLPAIIAELRRPERATKRSPIIIEKGTTRVHRNTNPYKSFLMVKMASGMDHGCVFPTTTNDDDVAQHGGHPQLIPSHAVLDYSIYL